MLRPKTYKCGLCKLTHGVFTENIAWKQFRETTKLQMEFLHLDEFKDLFPDVTMSAFPVILKQENDVL